MPKFPEPPAVAELKTLGPEVVTLPTGSILWRIHFAGGAHPTAWNEFRSYGPTPCDPGGIAEWLWKGPGALPRASID